MSVSWLSTAVFATILLIAASRALRVIFPLRLSWNIYPIFRNMYTISKIVSSGRIAPGMAGPCQARAPRRRLRPGDRQ